MGQDHSHHSLNYSRSFALGIGLNTLFVIIEAGYGFYASSLALLADAGHNLSDIASLLLAWGATTLAAKAATERRTYGFGKATVLASIASAVLLLIALGGIAWEAIGRFDTPQPVAGGTVIIVAAVGVVINTLTALLFYRGQKNDLNIRGAFLHMTADAAVSGGVVVAGTVILATGWDWIDPLVSLGIVLVVFISTWTLLRDSLDYAVDAVPKDVDIAGIRNYLEGFDHVLRIHDLHVWPLSTTRIALTVHLVVDDDHLDNAFLCTLQRHLHDRFGIEHATIQVENGRDEESCMLADTVHPHPPR